MRSTFIVIVATVFLKECHSWVTINTTGDWVGFQTSEYGVDIRGSNHVYFWLKCCSDCFLSLLPTLENANDHVSFSLGVMVNSKSSIKPCSSCGDSYTQEYPYLSCSELRPFWIGWTGSTLKLGQGNTVDEFIMTSVSDQLTFTPQFMQVSSGWSYNAVWRFQGNYQFNPPPCTSINFKFNDNVKASDTPLLSVTKATEIECLQECRVVRGCQSVNYNSVNQMCDLFNSKSLSVGTTDMDWKLWLVE